MVEKKPKKSLERIKVTEKIGEVPYDITEDDGDFYTTNGFFIAKKVFTERECSAILNQMRFFADNEFSAIMNPDRADFLIAQALESLPQDLTTAQRADIVRSATDVAEYMRGVMKDSREIHILETLHTHPLDCLMSQVLFKEAGSAYSHQAWNPHQDNSYPRNLKKEYITTNLFLLPADKENGSLYGYSGSHEEDLLESEDVPSYREDPASNPGKNILNLDEICKQKGYEKIDLIFDTGDLLVLNGNFIHGSYPNLSNRSRPLYSRSYISKGEPFIPGANARRMAIPFD